MLKIVIGTNEGKVLCISNNENKIKESMVNYLIDTDQEPTEDFFESRNWGEYDIEVYEYHQPQLNDNQQIVLDYLKKRFGKHSIFVKSIFDPISDLLSDIWIDDVDIAFEQLTLKQEIQVLEVFSQWILEQGEELWNF